MKKSNRLLAAGLYAVLVCGIAPAWAQDWPQWRGINRDGRVSGFEAPQTWPAELTRKWDVAVGSGDATPALVQDRLYVFARQDADEVILCLDAATGKEVWRNGYPARAPTGAAGRHPGPRSTPAVADGKIVTLGASGVISCLDAATGKLLWRNADFTSVPRFFTAMSPIILDGTAMVHVGDQGNGALVAFDLATGEVKWKWTGDGPAYSSPVLMSVDGTPQLVELTDKLVVGVAVADGKALWQLPFASRGRAYNAATPIVDGQVVIFTGAGRGTTAVRIEKQGDGFAVKELWSVPQLAPQYNTPVLKDGLLFGLSERGQLFCIDARTGQTAWTDDASRGNFGSIVDAGSVLLALPGNSELIAFKPDAKAYTELARYKVADKATYAHPVVAGKRVFVKDEDSLALWEIN